MKHNSYIVTVVHANKTIMYTHRRTTRAIALNTAVLKYPRAKSIHAMGEFYNG